MSPKPSQTLSNYRLIKQIGRGGMGVVWKAMDMVLDREVAIKILPNDMAHDAEGLARFEREAKLLASLNHPNIATVHGLHEDQDTRFLAMEFMSGEDLAKKLASGKCSLQQTMEIGKAVAAGVEEAHRNGVVHRDLKPANVMIGDNGQVKVLDFGLARRQESESEPIRTFNKKSTTDRKPGNTLTEPGSILGTFYYMSPEQARGKTADRQTDIWAFGCLLFEMLTGKRAFEGETPSDCIAAVLMAEPELEAVPDKTPVRLQRLIRRCLEKEPRRRWQDIGDVRIELEEIVEEQADDPPDKATASSHSWAARSLPWIVAMVAVGLAGYWGWQSSLRKPQASLPIWMTVEPDSGVELDFKFATVGVPSPDGSQIVYVAQTPEGRQLWIRSLEQLVARPLPGTLGGWQPFFSPDGMWVGFFADRKLKKVPVNGGSAQNIVEIGNNPRGGWWSEEGWIAVSPSQTSGLLRIDDEDGSVAELTELNFELGESTHRWPQVLPGGHGVLFTSRTEGKSFDQANLVIDPLDGSDPAIVIRGGAHGRYLASGHLLFARGGALYAVPFDLKQGQVTGEPVRVIDGVMYSHRNGGSQFAVANNGTLLFRPGTRLANDSRPVWVDPADAQSKPIENSLRTYRSPRVSPDGKTLLVSIFNGRDSHLWTLDVQQGTFTQISQVNTTAGRWVDPDGRFVVYAEHQTGESTLYVARSDGLGQSITLTTSPDLVRPCCVSPDGSQLVFQQRRSDTGWDLMLLKLDENGGAVGEPQPLLATAFNEERADFSRDGKFLTYESDELDGVVQIYVRKFPGMSGKRQVSMTGARQPRFSPLADEIYFWSTGSVQFRVVKFSVDEGTISPSDPQRLLESREFSVSNGRDGGVLADPSFLGFDIDPVSGRFVMLELEPTTSPPFEGKLVVVLNWTEQLKLKLAEATDD